MFGSELGAQAVGLILVFVFTVLAVLGFMLIARALLAISSLRFYDRGGALEDLRRRYAGGEINGQEFEARRRHLLAR